MTAESILEQLEKYRITNDIDISTFDKQIGLSPATYYNWKKGAPPKAVEILIRISNTINLISPHL